MVADREVDKVADMVADHDPSLVLVNWAQTFLTRLACLLKFASLFSSNVQCIFSRNNEDDLIVLFIFLFLAACKSRRRAMPRWLRS